MRMALMQPDRRLAEIFKSGFAVRDHHQAGSAGEIFESFLGLSLECGVTDRGQLVDKIGIEIEGKRHGERQPRTHARGIGFDRVVEGVVEFRELTHELKLVGKVFVDAVYPTDKLGVLPSAERSLEAAGQAQWPGHPTIADDVTPVRLVDAPYQPQQGGLARAVRANQRHAAQGWDIERHAFQHPLGTVRGAIALMDVRDLDHWAVNRVAYRICKARPRNTVASAQKAR